MDDFTVDSFDHSKPHPYFLSKPSTWNYGHFKTRANLSSKTAENAYNNQLRIQIQLFEQNSAQHQKALAELKHRGHPYNASDNASDAHSPKIHTPTFSAFEIIASGDEDLESTVPPEPLSTASFPLSSPPKPSHTFFPHQEMHEDTNSEYSVANTWRKRKRKRKRKPSQEATTAAFFSPSSPSTDVAQLITSQQVLISKLTQEKMSVDHQRDISNYQHKLVVMDLMHKLDVMRAKHRCDVMDLKHQLGGSHLELLRLKGVVKHLESQLESERVKREAQAVEI